MSVQGYSGANLTATTGAGDTLVLASKTGLKKNGTERGIMCFHGHGADAYTWQSAILGPGAVTRFLAGKGWVVVSDDFGGATPWANDTAMSDTDAIYGFTTGPSAIGNTYFQCNCLPKVDLMGWSMGGLTALNWLKRNPTKVNRVVLWAPATQIQYFHDKSSNYASEIEADYGGAANWLANVAGHEPAMEPANYRGLPPVRIYQGDEDPTVPPDLTIDFVNAVADPNMQVHILPGGNHTNLFGLVDPEEVADFLWGRAAA